MAVDLEERVDEYLSAALRDTAQAELKRLHEVIVACDERLRAPMRVALVGLIKAGKSTMVNALLGMEIVPTGAVETTFNVNWLQFGPKPLIRVHFKNGHAPVERPFDQLTAFTKRNEERRDELLNIEYVEVRFPGEMLRVFDLIDTPGFASSHEDDSKNTADFLGLHARDLDHATRREASRADAIVCLFSRAVAEADAEIVERFRGSGIGDANPLNAIGVLTKVETNWPVIDDPIAAGKMLAGSFRDNPRLRGLFYTVAPAAGLLASGAQTLTASDLETLVALATLPDAQFARCRQLVRNAQKFAKEYPDFPVSPERRQRVAERLGLYGVHVACDLLRATPTMDRESLVRRLLDQSGVATLRDVIRSHFGNRAYLIKLSTSLREISTACFEERDRPEGRALDVVRRVNAGQERLAEEHSFRELDVLRAYYDDTLRLTPAEVGDLLAVTGEHGRDLPSRLGLSADASIDDLVGAATDGIRRWRRRSVELSLVDRPTAHAAETLVRSYERLLRNAEIVKRHFYV